jgi:gluconolactonase
MSQTTSELQDVKVLAEGIERPEGPVAMSDGSVLFVEIAGQRLSKVDKDGARSVIAELPGGPNGAARGPDGSIYVCNAGHGGLRMTGASDEELAATGLVAGIQKVDPVTGHAEFLYTECDGVPLSSPNDIVFDVTGNFWFTDFWGDAIYYAAPDGSRITRALDRIPNPNGIALSPGGDVLYWAQTFTRQVMRRRLSGPGQIIPSPGFGVRDLRRFGDIDPYALLAGLPGAQELDSMAVDSAGTVCVGTLIEPGVTAISPDGAVHRYTLPEHATDLVVTNIAFGGPDLTIAFITLANTGRLISARWPRPGLRLEFQD